MSVTAFFFVGILVTATSIVTAAKWTSKRPAVDDKTFLATSLISSNILIDSNWNVEPDGEHTPNLYLYIYVVLLLIYFIFNSQPANKILY